MLRALTLRRPLQSLLHTNLTSPIKHPPRRGFCNASPPPPSPSPASASELRKYMGYTALVLFCGAATYNSFPFPDDTKHKKAQLFRYAPLAEELHTVSNWSGIHEVQTRVFHQPETLEELEKVVREANARKYRICPVGSGLSPNGIGLSRAGMVNLALMDKVLEVDKESKRVRVQAGIRVQQLVDGIKDVMSHFINGHP